jgi:hypothetical protein
MFDDMRRAQNYLISFVIVVFTSKEKLSFRKSTLSLRSLDSTRVIVK